MINLKNNGIPEVTINKNKGVKENLYEKLQTINETKFFAFFNGKKHTIEGKDLWDAKQKAITQLKVPKSKVGLLAVVSAKSQEQGDFQFN